MGELLDKLTAVPVDVGGQRSQIRAFLSRLSPEDASDVVLYLKRGTGIPTLARHAAQHLDFARSTNSWHKWSLCARAGDYDEYLLDG